MKRPEPEFTRSFARPVGPKGFAAVATTRIGPTSACVFVQAQACALLAVIETSMDVAALHDNSLPNCIEDNLGCVVQIELLHQIGSVGLDR